MLVNNELGTVQPVAEIVRAVRRRPPAWAGPSTCTATRSRPPGLVPLSARALGVDSLALSAHKLHGPKGAGALWLRPGARLQPLWDGGRQERGLRSGTENLPAQAGFAVAARWRCARAASAAQRAPARRWRPGGRPARPAGSGDRRPPAGQPAHRPGGHAARPAHRQRAAARPAGRADPARAGGPRGHTRRRARPAPARPAGPSHVLRALGVPDDAAVLRFSLSRYTAEDEPVLAAAGAAWPPWPRWPRWRRGPAPPGDSRGPRGGVLAAVGLSAYGTWANRSVVWQPVRHERPAMSSSVILCRYGELFLKLGNRGRFEQQLVDQRAGGRCAGCPASRSRTLTAGSWCARTPAQLDEAVRPGRAGVRAGLAVARPSRCRPELQAITDAAVAALAQAALERDPGPPPQLPHRGAPVGQALPALARRRWPSRLGAAVQRGHRRAGGSDEPGPGGGGRGRPAPAPSSSPTPDRRPGGLPVGASGRALLLLSGGIDSPVAGWLAAKRGLELHGAVLPLAAVRGRKVEGQGGTAGPHPGPLARAARACTW